MMEDKMKLKLFTQPTCPKCPAAKELVKKIEHKVNVEQHDIQTEDGLAEALEYGIMSTPSIVIIDNDDDVLGEWRSEVPSLEELNKIIK